MRRILVVGLGRFGRSLVRSLSEEGIEVIALSDDAAAVQAVKEYAAQAICGDLRDREVLAAVCKNGVDLAVVSVSHLVDQSALATLILKELGVKEVLARAESDDQRKLLQKIGADRIIDPTADSAYRLGKALASPHVQDFVIVGENFAIVESEVGEKVDGKTLKELELRQRFGVSVIAVLKPEEEDGKPEARMVMPTPDTVLHKEDVLLIIGRQKDLKRFREEF